MSQQHKQELTKEELEMRLQRLQSDFNMVSKMVDKIANKFVRKEIELASIEVKLEEVTQGFQALKSELESGKEDKAE